MPAGIKAIKHDANISVRGATGWLDALDPLYAEVADLWMQTLVADFGTDHWYQLDGYLNGGTAPWMETAGRPMSSRQRQGQRYAEAAAAAPPAPPPLIRGPIVAEQAWLRRGVAAYTGRN